MEPHERQQWWGALSAVLSDAVSVLRVSIKKLKDAVPHAAQCLIDARKDLFQADFQNFAILHGA